MTKDEITALGYLLPQQLPSGEWAAIGRMLFTTGLIVGITPQGYRVRYCYEHSLDAQAALAMWDGYDDPPGPWLKEKPGDRLGPGLVDATG